MQYIFAIVAVLLTLSIFNGLKSTIGRYRLGIYYYDLDQEPENDTFPESGLDLRGTPTHVCICGSKIWNIQVAFENYEIATYFLDMQCMNCGSIATAPTPLDRENME
jgi:hypothetical protein